MALRDDESVPFWFETGRGASVEDLVYTEKHLKHVLPHEYRELLLERDGGVSNYAGFQDNDMYLPILPILGVDSSAVTGTLLSAHGVRKAFVVPDDIVVFAAQGNAWWGLDYRDGRESPRIVYCDEPGTEISVVAADFASFLQRLVEE